MSWLIERLEQIMGKSESKPPDRHTELAKRLIKELLWIEFKMADIIQKDSWTLEMKRGVINYSSKTAVVCKRNEFNSLAGRFLLETMLQLPNSEEIELTHISENGSWRFPNLEVMIDLAEA